MRDDVRERQRREERAAWLGTLGAVLLVLAAAVIMSLLSGCRAVPSDVREAADALAEDLPLLLDVSGPREGLTPEEVEARATLEARVRATVATLRERAHD